MPRFWVSVNSWCDDPVPRAGPPMLKHLTAGPNWWLPYQTGAGANRVRTHDRQGLGQGWAKPQIEKALIKFGGNRFLPHLFPSFSSYKR